MSENNPSGPANKPTGTESATDALERAYRRESGDAKAEWLPPEMVAEAADKAVTAAAGVAAVDKITSSFKTKVQKHGNKP